MSWFRELLSTLTKRRGVTPSASDDNSEVDVVFPERTRKQLAYKVIKWSQRQRWRQQMPGLWEAGDRALAMTLQEELSDHVYGQEVPPHGFGSFVVRDGLVADPGRVFQAYIEPEDDFATCLGIILVALRVLENWSSQHHDPMTAQRAMAQNSVAALVEDFNRILARDGIPWRYTEGALVPVGEPQLDEQVEVALRCLSDPNLLQVDQEYRRALEHFGAGKPKDSITAAGQAVEGMLRVMVRERHPARHKSTLTHGKALGILRGSRPWPNGVDKAVEAVGVIRDQLGAHSDTTKPDSEAATPAEARLQLHLAAVVLEYLAHVRRSS